MKRVVIVGIPGSGKTTFSKHLAKVTQLPLTNLDYYFHQTDKNYYEDKEAWVEFVAGLAKEDEWILEGNFPRVFELRARASDTIIFLDFKRMAGMWGVIKRVFKHRRGRSRFGMPDNWVEKLNLDFLMYVWRFTKSDKYKDMKSLFNELTDDRTNGITTHRFTNREQLYRWLDGLK
jgi:adenylate kinase family enzyme